MGYKALIRAKLLLKYKSEKAVIRILEKHLNIPNNEKISQTMSSLLKESRRELNSIKTKLSYSR